MDENGTGRRRSGDQAVALFWGEDEFLLREAANDLLAEFDVHADEVAASDWRGGETGNLATPSLFGGRRALVVTGGQSMTDPAGDERRAYLPAPAPDAVLVLSTV